MSGEAAAAPQEAAAAPAAPSPRPALVPLGAPAAVCGGDTCALPS
ncbi:hypothetical protein [Leifsonia sp. C5G2]|nr:hypothetical protein [Leifsonia sp. C5G2]